MQKGLKRRDFIRLTAAGGTFCIGYPVIPGFRLNLKGPKIISPGCRTTKVKVARLYIASDGLWPKPNLDLENEIRTYKSEFAKLKDDLSDVDFVVDELVTTPEDVVNIKDRLLNVDGILVIHLTLGVSSILNEILSAGQPTMIFAVPYSGHEWSNFGTLQKQPIGAKMDCILSGDYTQLAAAIKPFRAIHHLREARILNITNYSFAEYADSVKEKFGTDIIKLELDRINLQLPISCEPSWNDRKELSHR